MFISVYILCYYVFRGGRPMHAVYGNPMYGRGKGRVWMNGVNCTGNEKHLNECEFPGWAINEPGHGQDVTVQCLPSGSITETYKRKYPEFQKHKKVSGLFEQIRNCCSIFMPYYFYIYSVLYGILGTVKAAPHECVIRTGQP